jgi:hypothetical protein
LPSNPDSIRSPKATRRRGPHADNPALSHGQGRGARRRLDSLPHANIAVGTRILKESIRRGGTEVAGLQLYNGAADDETRAYANRVLSERRRLEQALPRARDRAAVGLEGQARPAARGAGGGQAQIAASNSDASGFFRAFSGARAKLLCRLALAFAPDVGRRRARVKFDPGEEANERTSRGVVARVLACALPVRLIEEDVLPAHRAELEWGIEHGSTPLPMATDRSRNGRGRCRHFVAETGSRCTRTV